MTVRELLQHLLDHALDGRGAAEQVLIECDGGLLTIADIEIRITEPSNDTPNFFVLVVADGPSDTPVASAITPRAPKL